MHDRNPSPVARQPAGLFFKAGVVFGLTLLTALVCWLTPEPKAGGEAGVVMSLPDEVGELYGHDQEVTAVEKYLLPKDTTFARKTYGLPGTPDGPDRILLSIILSGAERRSIHRPERCLPSQGWRIDSSRTETVPLASGRDLKVTALLLEKTLPLRAGGSAVVRNYYLYWFVGKNVATPSQTTRILMTYWDMLFHRVNQRWAYVIVSKDIAQDWYPGGEGPGDTLTQLKTFIRDSVPTYMKTEMTTDTASAQ